MKTISGRLEATKAIKLRSKLPQFDGVFPRGEIITGNRLANNRPETQHTEYFSYVNPRFGKAKLVSDLAGGSSRVMPEADNAPLMLGNRTDRVRESVAQLI
jgi:hypothetical protein